MSQQKSENFLEPFLRRRRIARVLPFIKKMPDCRLLDIGCGWEARFLREVAPHIAQGIGIDPKAPPLAEEKGLTTFQSRLTGELPFESASFDVVTMLAVLEHLSEARAIVAEVWRVLRPGGWFVGTVPGTLAKPVLEFLAYRLNIVNPEEIRDHKAYYSRASLCSLLVESGFSNPGHEYFQLGMNNFFYAQKT